MVGNALAERRSAAPTNPTGTSPRRRWRSRDVPAGETARLAYVEDEHFPGLLHRTSTAAIERVILLGFAPPRAPPAGRVDIAARHSPPKRASRVLLIPDSAMVVSVRPACRGRLKASPAIRASGETTEYPASRSQRWCGSLRLIIASCSGLAKR